MTYLLFHFTLSYKYLIPELQEGFKIEIHHEMFLRIFVSRKICDITMQTL